MRKTKILVAVFSLLAACAYKLPEAKVLKIFERHSFKPYDTGQLKALLRENGPAGLKLVDKYAGVVKAGPRVKTAPGRPARSTGMLLGMKGKEFRLLRVFRDSPAAAAGLKDGDRLIALDSYPAGSAEFLQALAGESKLKVKVERRSRTGAAALETELEKGEFYFPPVFGLYEPETRTAFVKIGLFFGDSGPMVASGLDTLGKYGVKNVVFDLRGNKGGSPGDAAEVLRLFAQKPGPVLSINSRHKGYTQVFEAAEKGRFAGLRAAALVDGDTAMAGEVFAASLREICGARVAGSKTAGNVSVLKTFSLEGERGLQLTVARLVPPSGADLEGAGLVPDMPFELTGKETEDARSEWAGSSATALLEDAAYAGIIDVFRGGKRPWPSDGHSP